MPNTTTYVQEPVAIVQELTEREVINDLISRYSKAYEVSEATMHKVVACESSYNPKALGDGGQSRGLVQIHRPSWPNITDEQAYDPEFALEFLARKLSEGKGYLWTCHRMHYGR